MATASKKPAPRRVGRGKGTDPALREALKQAKLERPVLPLKRDKAPRTRNGVTDATTDAEQIERWAEQYPACAWGMATGSASGVVVVDADTYKPGGADVGPLDLPRTMTVTTGQGGKQYWFRAPAEPTKNNNTGRLGTNIDYKTDGGYVVLPDSRTVFGLYAASKLRSLAPLPEQVVSRLHKAADGSGGLQAGDGLWTEGERHPKLTSYAGRLRNAGMDLSEILAALRALNEERCNPPKADDEVVEIAEWAAGQDRLVEQKKVEIRARQQAQREIAQEDAQTSLDLPAQVRTLADELAEEDEPFAYTVDRLHPSEGNTLIVASYKAGKTHLAINLMRSLVDGEPFLGEFDTALPAGRVGYLNYEVSKRQFKHWLRQSGIRNTKRVVRLDLRGKRVQLSSEIVREELARWLRERDVRLLIVDPLARASAGTVTEENSNSQAIDMTDALDHLKHLADIPDLVVVTHSGKGEDGTSRGASRYMDWPDAIWNLDKDAKGIRTFYAEGRDVDIAKRDARVLGYDSATRRLTVQGTSRAVREDDKDALALRAVTALLLLGDGAAKSTLRNKIAGGTGRGYREEAIEQAITNLWIEAREEPGRHGGKTIGHYVTSAGRQAHVGSQRRTVKRGSS